MVENFNLAHKLNEKLHETLKEHKIHFRGNVGSLSLISLSKITPELGIPCDPKKYLTEGKSEEQLLVDIALLRKNKTKAGRDTKEKELQAWIIYHCLLNGRQIPFDKTIKFITSEMALPSKIGPKVVSDIIGFCEKRKKISIIELKTSRDKTRLIEQVNNFEAVIWHHQDFVVELLKYHGFYFEEDISKMIEKIIVWPHENNVMTSKALKNAGITEYGYIEKGEDYVFIRV